MTASGAAWGRRPSSFETAACVECPVDGGWPVSSMADARCAAMVDG
ncbi:conserved hypothetical protein [Burkholderia pseudomallei S13]|uniref:Uncharacterized protein n=1 Tax=Burkholderia pseudomallei (strain 1710b) TaxID=320372 RepID=Q3JUJ8_BURP1|nr:hypothetical protein BURPS1710b_1345 [Burkholderia pseudomallei 1710b]EDK58493.1 hypothetical protein BMAJHU_0150 [Burkholderia mallei JHU]EDO93987.1 conserved hypothetical protein [Burkholderia pseudomallei Pasteur 52237]EDS84441.1 conserved hypothetical protein [Burkholderia pseudomallei S13]